METIFKNLRENSSLVHCTTNYVTVNDLANIILAGGASPIMADDLGEIDEIVSISSSLLINIGTLNSRTVDSMLRAGKKANERSIPVILDPVGVGASSLRIKTVDRLLREIDFSLIKGNASEMKFLYKRELSTSGVDVQLEDIITEDNLKDYIAMAKELSGRYRAVIAITGPIDIVVGGNEVYTISNGNSYMEKITGTGCMLGGLLAGVLASNKDRPLESSVLGLVMMGLAGDYARDYVDTRNLGTGSFRTSLIDKISRMTYKNIEEDGRFEKR